MDYNREEFQGKVQRTNWLRDYAGLCYGIRAWRKYSSFYWFSRPLHWQDPFVETTLPLQNRWIAVKKDTIRTEAVCEMPMLWPVVQRAIQAKRSEWKNRSRFNRFLHLSVNCLHFRLWRIFLMKSKVFSNPFRRAHQTFFFSIVPFASNLVSRSAL